MGDYGVGYGRLVSWKWEISEWDMGDEWDLEDQ